MSQPLTTAELRDKWVWLLELTWAGRVHRWSSGQSVEVTSDDGDLHYRGGLDVEWEEASDLLTIDSTPRSVSWPELWLPEDVDPAALIEAGHDLAAARGELSLWAPGRTYDERRVLLAGRVTAPTYGGADEPIGLTLEERPYDDGATIIPATAEITRDTWPNADTGSIGRAYPLVIGTPGVYTEADGTSGLTTGSPAYIIDTVQDWLLIAGHRVQASTVRIIDVSDGTADTIAVQHTTDGLGRTIAYVDATAGTVTVSAGDEYWVRWSTGGGGAYDDDQGDLTYAGEVLRYMLRRSSLRVDRGRLYAALAYLNRYKLSFYVNDPEIAPWDWLADNLLPLLPMSIIGGPEGLRPVLYRTDITDDDATTAIEAGPDALRVSRVQYDTEEPIQRVRLEYAPRGDSDDHLRTVVYDGAGADVASGVGTVQALRRSQLRYVRDGDGQRALSLTTDIVYDDATAQLIARDLARLRALPHRTVEYDCDPWRYGHLEPGDVVTITDAELSWASELAIVQGIGWSPRSMSVTLLLPGYLGGPQ